MGSRDNILNEFWADPKILSLVGTYFKCEPFLDQLPGPGGIRRPVSDFQQQHYVEMWVQSILTYLGPKEVTNSTWIIGGDGRFYFREAFYRVASVLGAHKVKRIVSAKDGLLTTPAMCMMIKREKALGGILLTASHMGAGPKGFFGMKYCISSGRSERDSTMFDIFEKSKELSGYKAVKDMYFPLSELVSYGLTIDDLYTTVMICDVAKHYADLMETIFDFNVIRKLFGPEGTIDGGFQILVDCMHASAGPYAEEIFLKRLRCKPGTLLNFELKESYPKGDPSPRNSKELVNQLTVGRQGAGFGLDSDGDRVMVLGRKGLHVSPGDSIAILAAHLHCIPYFQVRGIKGIARTLSVSPAVDRVARQMRVQLYEVPVGLTHFCNLIEADLISFWGDESYGLGSCHLLEKDGIWGILAWLSVLQHMKMPIHELLFYHWKKYGRIFSIRMDYDGIEDTISTALMNAMEATVMDASFFGTKFGEPPFEYILYMAENFSYEDPTGKEDINKAGVKITFDCESRILCRMSETRSKRFRLYLEHFSLDPNTFTYDPSVMTKTLYRIALQLTNIGKYFGRTKPTNIV